MRWTNSTFSHHVSSQYHIGSNIDTLDPGTASLLSYGCSLLQLVVLSASGLSLLRFMSRYRATISDTLFGFAHFTLVFIMCLKASMVLFSNNTITFRIIMGFVIFGCLLVFLMYLVYHLHSKLNFYGDLEEGSLHLAAMSGDNKKIKELLATGKNPNGIGGDLWEGYPPIFPAIHQGIVDTVELLLDEGANVNWQYKRGTSALHFTIRMYHLLKEESLSEVFDLLISRQGIDLDCEAIADNVHASIPTRWSVHLDEERRKRKQRLYSGTPLSLAIRLGCGKMAEKLIKKGARVDKVCIDFQNDFKFETESFYAMKLLFYSGFRGFPRDCNQIRNSRPDEEEAELKFEDFKRWLQSKMFSPLSMKQLSRIAAIKYLPPDRKRAFRELGLPSVLESYLMLQDIVQN